MYKYTTDQVEEFYNSCMNFYQLWSKQCCPNDPTFGSRFFSKAHPLEKKMSAVLQMLLENKKSAQPGTKKYEKIQELCEKFYDELWLGGSHNILQNWRP